MLAYLTGEIEREKGQIDYEFKVLTKIKDYLKEREVKVCE